MQENKILIIKKLFQDREIRTVWDKDGKKYYLSIVDVVGVLSESKFPRRYWSDLKIKLRNEGSELYEKIVQLKLQSSDGKYYLTDVCDIEGIFRIIQSVPSKNAEPIKQWLARLGRERIDEVVNPSLSIDRAIELYRLKGYDEDWINKRISSIQDRVELTDVWRERGIALDIEFAILTNEICKSWSGMTTSEYKKYKGLKEDSLRDNMDKLELLLTNLSEEVTKRLVVEKNPYGLEDNLVIASIGGKVSKVAKDEIEKELESSVITNNNKIEIE